MNVIIANIIFFIASILMLLSGVIKKKNKIVISQTVQIILMTIGDLLLQAYTGALINTIAIFRNILSYKNKLNLPLKIIITIISVVCSIFINDMSVIGFLPVVTMLLYIWLMNTKDVIRYKYLMIFTLILWFIYDITIKAYVSASFDFITIIVTIISIIQIKNTKKDVINRKSIEDNE